jgi:hypothetical protein
MSTQIKLIASLSVLAVTLLALSTLFAADPKPSDWSAAERAYVTANLELAESRLALAVRQQKAVVDSVSQDTIDALRANVTSFKDHLAHLDGTKTPDPFTAQIAAARRELDALEVAHNKSLEANRIAAGAVPPIDLENEVAEINVAKARLAVLQAIANQPAEVRIQWQIGQLQDQIRALWARPMIED